MSFGDFRLLSRSSVAGLLDAGPGFPAKRRGRRAAKKRGHYCSVEKRDSRDDYHAMCDDPEDDLAALGQRRRAQPPLDHEIDRLDVPAILLAKSAERGGVARLGVSRAA